MRFTRAAVEREFRLEQPNWEDDEHEHCQLDDNEAARRLLAIDEDWPAV